jgi:malate dehydrogenase (oxaloacetate-decarboxylating)
MRTIGTKISKQQIVMLGAGSSATGISDQIVSAMISEGLSFGGGECIDMARGQPRPGSKRKIRTRTLQAEVCSGYRAYKTVAVIGPEPNHILRCDQKCKTSILLGTSAQPGAFSEDVIREMAKHVERPVIFPLSNPTSKSEAIPADLIRWTEGRALVATGSPFAPVVYKAEQSILANAITLCCFPGVGLGVIGCGVRRGDDEPKCLWRRTRALGGILAGLIDPTASL